MKMIFILTTSFILVLIKHTEPYKTLYNYKQDSFPHWKFAAFPCLVLSFVIHLIGGHRFHYFSFMEWAWTFSIILESIAILPQLVVLRKYRLVENLTGKFMVFQGLYRFLYILNWIYRSHTERNYRHSYLVYACGVVQTAIYLDFYYQYCRITRLSRCCVNKDRAADEDGDDSESLIFEGERELPSRDTGATESLLVDSGMADEMQTDGLNERPISSDH